MANCVGSPRYHRIALLMQERRWGLRMAMLIVMEMEMEILMVMATAKDSADWPRMLANDVRPLRANHFKRCAQEG